MPYKDASRNREYQKEWKRQQKQRLWDYKATLSCNRCGFSHPAAIQFHHEGDKEHNVGRMAASTYSWEQILAEIAKCEVLCANCHFIHHFDDGYNYGNKYNPLKEK